jgi:acetyl-CoA C-acetyltransferase
VWSSTVVRIAVGDRHPPYGLAVVDLADGPRILAHLADDKTLPPGTSVEVTGSTADGDVLVEASAGIGHHPVLPPWPAPRLPPPADLTRPVFVQGVGTSGFGRFPDRRLEDLAWEAVFEALEDAGIGPADIDAVWVGSVFAPGAVTPRILRGVGISGVPVMRVENACASGTTAYHEAVNAVGSGRYGCVLALGIEQLSVTFSGPIVPDLTDPDGATGLALPALYALQANRYLAENPAVSIADLATVAVKNKANGMRNPRAQLHRSPSLDEVLDSRPIADPLTFLQCCPLGDGAAAAVISQQGDVAVRSSVMASGALWDQRSQELWGESCVARAASVAFKSAKLSPADLDVLEVHDAFTIGEVSALEAIGVAKIGEGWSLASSGHTAHGGRQPVNPSGGLLSRGHPLGATGLAQVAEIVWQLRDLAAERQVPDARLGLVETMGGGAAGVDGNASVVTILERAGR